MTKAAAPGRFRPVSVNQRAWLQGHQPSYIVSGGFSLLCSYSATDNISTAFVEWPSNGSYW